MQGGARAREPGARLRAVLVADDDPAMLDVVCGILQLDGFSAIRCVDGASVLPQYRTARPDAVVLDVRLPDVDGVSVCRLLRAESTVPILMLTAFDDTEGAARALEAGADDYVRKPFAASELIARVNAALRRTEPGSATLYPVLSCGPVDIDERQHSVKLEEREIALSPIEFRLLVYFCQHANQLLRHDEILSHVWSARYAGSHHLLRVTVSRLRQKLGLERHAEIAIQAVGGVGYRLQVRDGGRMAG